MTLPPTTRRLSGKVTLITGSGIGRATAIVFATEGAIVLCTDRDVGTAAAMAEAIRQRGGHGDAFPPDVTSEYDGSVPRNTVRIASEETLMPEDLLLGLGPAAPVAGSLDNIRDLLKVARREFGWAAEGLKGTTLKFEKAWERIVLDVSRGRTEQMHALRPQFLLSFQTGFDCLKKAQTTALALRRPDRSDAPYADVILPEIAGMERFKARVFDLWQTAEDLEDLAARDYPLTTADLDEIGPHRRPAPSYYAEESKPF